MEVLTYVLDVGPSERQRIEQAFIQNKPLPPSIQNAPILNAGLEFYFEAFLKLSSCRPQGFSGVSPIPWDKMVEYCRVYDLDEDAFYDFEDTMRALDGLYIKDKEAKIKRDRESKSKPKR